MNTFTGEVVELTDAQKEMLKDFVPIERDLTFREKMEKQILLYSPCGCGSGKNFKFCCHTPHK